jgi:hypothetical protein
MKTTTFVGLRQIFARGVIDKAQLKVWEGIRHSVMDESLISPYSSQKEDGKLMKLAEMMHALTREIFTRCSSSGL